MLTTQGGLGPAWRHCIFLHALPIRKKADNPMNQSKLKEENCRANRGKMPVTVGFGHMIQRNRLSKEKRT